MEGREEGKERKEGLVFFFLFLHSFRGMGNFNPKLV
jgi:hypothetical protein